MTQNLTRATNQIKQPKPAPVTRVNNSHGFSRRTLTFSHNPHTTPDSTKPRRASTTRSVNLSHPPITNRQPTNHKPAAPATNAHQPQMPTLSRGRATMNRPQMPTLSRGHATMNRPRMPTLNRQPAVSGADYEPMTHSVDRKTRSQQPTVSGANLDQSDTPHATVHYHTRPARPETK